MINQNWQGIEPDPIALGSESARLNEAVVFGDTFAIIMKKNQPVPLLASDAIRESVGKACLTDLPWLSQKSRDEERAVFAEFEKRSVQKN